MMDTAYMAYREMRIEKNRRRRARIVRNQQLALALIIAVVVALFVFLASMLVTHAQSEPVRYKYYTSVTVSYGDTLSDIADRYMTEEYPNSETYIWEVCNINHLEDGDSLMAGTDIIVPYYSDEFK